MGDSPEDVSPSSEWPRRSMTGRCRPRSISGVDGPTSRLPSSSVASVATSNLPARRSMKETFNSPPVTPNTYIDPPRPPREGHEWVWFPAGYWAEREIVEAPGKAMRHFKWRKRSGKSSSGRDTQDDLEHSPSILWDMTPKTPKTPKTPQQPLPSPFLTEETHVQSLQRPPFNRHGTSSESGSSFPLNRMPQAPLPSPYLTEEAHVQSLQRSPLGYQSSDSSTSQAKSTRLAQTSPLTVTKDSNPATPLTAVLDQRQHQLVDSPVATLSFSSLLHLSPASQSQSRALSQNLSRVQSPDAKPKKSFIARLLPDHKSKIKKTHSDNDKPQCPYVDSDAYDYTASTIEGARARLLTHSQSQSPTPLISRVTTLLREESRRSRGGSGSSSSGWSRSFKLFGKSPWHRKASAGSEASASSSVRDVLRGRTPVTSPASDIEPLNSVCTQFPGGEATRVQTPPLRESGRNAARPRSFFFDISTPPIRDCSSSSGSERDEPQHSPPPTSEPTKEQDKPKNNEENKRDSGKEWWEVPVAVPRYEVMAPSSFEFDMPEHLPNSPMCPANKRHKSGGTGVCVYHGRRKRSQAVKDESDGKNVTKEVWT
ncbi:uncharacterized protein F4822DRAFT_444841 [Hypoxylon trugodes]|uniref:uncharacterized protein n=1 Tax=Hypoxylon trugodes TaxID=326681 RepID=UPI0021909247|nr:uncharacterized protein F4822DRAFT_444841 [Hypoxylon trugodes]KAI1386448.1 hypothetical protein F4822DRAFT_444841 [Hypoxylon trugodes]